MGTLTRALIRGDGTAESQWRPWLAQLGEWQRLRPAEVSASVIALTSTPVSRDQRQGLVSRPSAWPRLVVVAPHPDDEVLACGGLIRRQMQNGGNVTVIAVTDGEACHGPMSRRALTALAAQRRRERRRSLARLVTGRVRTFCLRLPDGRVADHAAVLSGALAQHTRRGDVVVTTWHRDGHPDHEACGAAAQRWCREAGIALLQAPVWMWHWSRPGDPRVPWERLIAMPLDGATVAAKHAALRLHHSQHRASPRDGRPILGRAIVARNLRPVEYFLADLSNPD